MQGLALQVQEGFNVIHTLAICTCFRGRRGDLVKIIWHDGQGACLFTKRLERGRFMWPSMADGVVTISAAQMSYLLEGIDWRMPQKTWRPRPRDELRTIWVRLIILDDFPQQIWFTRSVENSSDPLPPTLSAPTR